MIGLRDGTVPSHDAPSAMRKSPPGPTTSLGAIALGEKDAYGPRPPGRAIGDGELGAPGLSSSAAPAASRTTRKKPARSAQDLEKEREWKRRKELVREERQRKKRQEEASGMPGEFLGSAAPWSSLRQIPAFPPRSCDAGSSISALSMGNTRR